MIPNHAPLFLALLLSGSPAPDAPGRHAVCIIAHRGASGSAPENTLAAFTKAVDLGADIIELDVRQTRDTQLVVLHDATVDRTTDGSGRVADLTAAEIRALDAGSWFSLQFARERIPLLADVIEAIPDSVILLIELKDGSDRYPGIEERLVRTIRAKRPEKRVILKSFDDDHLDRLRALAPEIPRLKIIVAQISFLGIIIEHGLRFGSVLNDSVQYLQHHWFGLSRSFIDDAHLKGYKVFVWDVHDEEKMRDMTNMGVDGIETDYPERLKTILQAR